MAARNAAFGQRPLKDVRLRMRHRRFSATWHGGPTSAGSITRDCGGLDEGAAPEDIMWVGQPSRDGIRFLAWLRMHEVDVVVFDMDASEPFVLPGKAFKETAKACQAGMSSARTAASFLRDLVNSQAGCGADRADGGEEAAAEYIAGASPDFVEALQLLAAEPDIRLAVATNSDPVEYDLPGQSRETHILGPDLAAALIGHWCPQALPKFEAMVGFDPSLPEHADEPMLPGTADFY
ncbi:hypothetical protein AK812_SmicGene35121 [Symbiodinium microadriaticum]|uniref:Uncharacterized protein n=1 Tax=Symbiodinium microadriaticum TaxID=2951 RepID=A0A1Q9CM86_SYMMI|nr:hypothetical protein AK812_SmicGene35121 [Symbiodinium microadriaticum]